MTQIKTILDGNGVQYYPQTHTKAVVDDNGYTAESRLQAMQDEINAAQLEIGAVESDLTPTENSVNYVTSGGVYNAIKGLPDVEHLMGSIKVENISVSNYAAVGSYINMTSDVWAAGGNSNSVNIPVDPERIYTITAHATRNTRYAWLKNNSHTNGNTPNYCTGETLKELTANTTKKFYPPSDAKYLNITYKLSTNDTSPQSIAETYNIGDIYDEIDDVNEKIQSLDYNTVLYKLKQKYIVDARTASSTFGQDIEATSTDWGVSQFIDLAGCKKVKYHANTVSTSSNYYDKTGTVYYDENKTPLTDGVRLITSGNPAKLVWIEEDVPTGARYMKVSVSYTHNQNENYKIYLNKIYIEHVYDLQNQLDAIDSTFTKPEYDILKNSRYSADGATSGTVAFLHFSDIHGDANAAKAIRAYYDKYSSYITDMVSTGDLPYYYAADGIDFYVENNLTDALLALGNHDGYTSAQEWDGKGAQWDYNTYYEPYISGWNVTQPEGAAENYLMYYYKDYATPKVRLIVLDVMHQDADQLQWFQDTLSSAITADYTVVVASHYVPNTYTADYIVKRADGDKTTFQSYASNSLTSIDTRFKLNTAYADAVETFISNNGKFAVWLCGHYHTDYFTYSNTHPNILFCAINQAGYRRGGGLGYRQVGDHCANMVTIHPTSGLIKIHRIGLTTDRFLRPINVVTYDYINKKVITNY